MNCWVKNCGALRGLSPWGQVLEAILKNASRNGAYQSQVRSKNFAAVKYEKVPAKKQTNHYHLHCCISYYIGCICGFKLLLQQKNDYEKH
jgi:hypothetical protein